MRALNRPTVQIYPEQHLTMRKCMTLLRSALLLDDHAAIKLVQILVRQFTFNSTLCDHT